MKTWKVSNISEPNPQRGISDNPSKWQCDRRPVDGACIISVPIYQVDRKTYLIRVQLKESNPEANWSIVSGGIHRPCVSRIQGKDLETVCEKLISFISMYVEVIWLHRSSDYRTLGDFRQKGVQMQRLKLSWIRWHSDRPGIREFQDLAKHSILTTFTSSIIRVGDCYKLHQKRNNFLKKLIDIHVCVVPTIRSVRL